MSVQLCFEKKDLMNIISSLTNTAYQIRQQRIALITDSHFIKQDISLLDEYYSKRMELIERNKQNIEWLAKKMEEAKTEGGNVIAVMTLAEGSVK